MITDKQYEEFYKKMHEMREQLEKYFLFLRENDKKICELSREELETHEKGYEHVFRAFRYLDDAVANLNNVSERISQKLTKIKKNAVITREMNENV